MLDGEVLDEPAPGRLVGPRASGRRGRLPGLPAVPPSRRSLETSPSACAGRGCQGRSSGCGGRLAGAHGASAIAEKPPGRCRADRRSGWPWPGPWRTEPRLLLLDEPLAALDAGTKLEVRRELSKHLGSFEGTALLVTHNPLEAAALADRLIVLENGRVIQDGTSTEVAQRPRSAYVAELVGLNLIRGKGFGDHVEVEDGGRLVGSVDTPRRCLRCHPPPAVALHRSHPEGSPRNVWEGTVSGIDLEGERTG